MTDKLLEIAENLFIVLMGIASILLVVAIGMCSITSSLEVIINIIQQYV